MPFTPKKHRVVEEAEDTAQVEEAPKATKVSIASQVRAEVRKILKFSTFEPEQRFWLDTGDLDVNAALGSREKGLAYGTIAQIVGEDSAGKTTLGIILASKAQAEGAGVGRVDLEDSRDESWDRALGLDPSEVVEIYPEMVISRKTKKLKGAKRSSTEELSINNIPQLQGAEDMFQEMEVAMARYAAHGIEKQLWLVDSVANIQTEMQVEAGANNEYNMRVGLDRALFLSRTLPRLAGLASNYNALILLLNQVRDKQGVFFGDPKTTTGGRSLRHCCKVTSWVRRARGSGTLKRGSKVIGFTSIITNKKNKAGSGSVQNCTAAFRVITKKLPATVQFMSREAAEGEVEE